MSDETKDASEMATHYWVWQMVLADRDVATIVKKSDGSTVAGITHLPHWYYEPWRSRLARQQKGLE